MLPALDYYGIKFVITGIIGCFLGSLTSHLNWDQAMKTLVRPSFIVICGALILLYYVIMFYLGRRCGPVKVYYHLIPTVIMILFIYVTSYCLVLNNILLVRIPIRTLSRNILFAYLFHIMVINILFFFIRKDSLDFFETSMIGFFILVFTIATCFFVDFLNSRSAFCEKIYATFFKL